jgi:hypothetical protein
MVSDFRSAGSRTRDDGRGESIDEFAHSGGNTRSGYVDVESAYFVSLMKAQIGQ